MANTVQLKKDGQIVYPVTDVSLIIGLQDAIKLPPIKTTTLPTASAETAGKMYYVGPDANDEYERYITSAVNGSYEWIDLGGTEIPLPSIADNLTTDDANTALSAKQGKILNEEIEGLEAEVDEFEQDTISRIGGIFVPVMNIEQGAISSSNGQDTSSSTRIRTANYISGDAINIITSGSRVYVMGYKADGTFVSARGWLNTSQTVSINGADKYRLVFAKANDSTITVDDFDSLGVAISVSFNSDFPSKEEFNELSNEVYKVAANVKNYTITRGATYTKDGRAVIFTLANDGTIIIRNVDSGTVAIINGPYEVTLDGTPRFLVVNSSGVIATRDTSNSLRDGDFVLLYYDDNGYNEDVVGGALYPDYLKSKIEKEIEVNRALLIQDNDVSLIATIGPSICTHLGYIDENGLERVGGVAVNYKYSDPVSILAGQSIIISGVGAGIPSVIVCDSNGTFISYLGKSSGITSVFRYTFQEDIYIRVQGRFVPDENGNIVSGMIYKDNNPHPTTDYALEQVKKYVSVRGAVYVKNDNDVSVTLNTLFVFSALTNTNSTINDSTTYSLSGLNRFLVLTEGGTIATRATSAKIKQGDFVLFYFDDNSANNDIVGGALYADYIKSKTNEEADNEFPEIPSNLGQVNCVRKAHQMASFKWTPKQAEYGIPYNDTSGGVTRSFTPEKEQTGLIYSSAKEYTQFVFEDVSLETFMTAVYNNRSVLYTEKIGGNSMRSALGRTYHGVNCAAYYGSVCSGLLTFAYGLPVNVTTYEFRNWEKMEVIEDQTPYGLVIGDAIWQSGHIQLVTGITRNKYGIITKIEVVENAAATTRIKNFSASSLQNYITTNNCVLLRYKDLYTNRNYTPLTDFVAVDDETLGSYTYNDDICPNYGDKSNYNEGDSVVLNLRTDFVSAGFTTLEVYKDDVLLISRAISGQDETLTGLSYGDYKARITGTGVESAYAQFKVVNADVAKNGSSFSFSSQNATPVYYEFCDLQGRRSYDIVGLSTHAFTDAEILAGSATPSGDVVSTGDYRYLKVHFQTDYGRVIKVIDWRP